MEGAADEHGTRIQGDAAADDGTTTVRSSQRAVDVLRARSGGWVVRIPGWNLMSPFPTKLEAVTYAEEWLFGRI